MGKILSWYREGGKGQGGPDWVLVGGGSGVEEVELVWSFFSLVGRVFLREGI